MFVSSFSGSAQRKIRHSRQRRLNSPGSNFLSGDRLKRHVRDEESQPSETNLWKQTYGTIAKSPPNFLSIIDKEGLAIHDPNFCSCSSGRNLCVRPNVGPSCDATAFSSSHNPAARAACGTATAI